jgi:perosamine synthetase
LKMTLSDTSKSFIPLCVPEISGNEWDYVKECLDTNWVSSVGSFVDRFEDDLAGYVGCSSAVAVTSGTAALHTSLLIAGVQPDDEVLVSTLTFIAPANAIRYCGAWPVFIDAEPNYWQMDVAKVADFLENDCVQIGGELRNKTTERRVKAIVPVHVLGHAVDIDPIIELAQRYSLAVIEDATESLGGMYKGRMIGSIGDMACFSFNGNKLMTTGGGGMIATNNVAYAERARYLTTQAKDDPVEYIHDEIGYNYRLTNIQAAIGCAQLEGVQRRVESKRAIAKRYADAFANMHGITTMPEASWATSAFWMYTMLIDEEKAGIDSRSLLRKLADEKIQTRPLWQPIHMSKAHSQSTKRECPVAERLYRDALSLPCSAGLTESDQGRVIETVTKSVAVPSWV